MSIVFIGSDHRGFQLKQSLIEWLRVNGYNCQDIGNDKYELDDDYTDFAFKTAEKTVKEKGFGVVICGSGVGVCIAANKVKGARAALCTTEKQARLAREDDNANILCLGSDLVKSDESQKILETFLTTMFSSLERHVRRLNKINKYESSNN